MNRKDRRGNKTTYLSGNTGIRLICEAVAVELLLYAMLAIFRSAFGWQLPIRALGKLQVAMLVSLVLFIGTRTVWNFSSEKTDRERKNAVSGISVILE